MPRPLGKINKIDPAELKVLKNRIDIATAVIIFFIAILISRLWFLQIHSGSDYAQQSESNRIRIQDIAAPRGNILDRTGRILVTNRPQFNIVWIREDAPNPDEVIKRLSKILDEDISVLLDRIRYGADHPRYVPTRLKEDIDWRTLVYIENNHFNLPGVRIEVLPSRDYLYKDLSSHLIGYLAEINQKELQDSLFTNYEGGDQIGKSGVEKLFENYLRGEKGRKFLEVDVHGFEQRQLKLQEPLPGNDLQLTIDIELQQAAEEAMADKAGAVVAMEVNTGKLLVLCSTPPLKLEDFIGGISNKAWKALLENPFNPLINKAIQGQYPPGSTYKIITALAALTEKIVTPETVYYCSGSHTFGNRSYGCWKKGGHGAVNLHKALVESCDVYFYQVGQKLGVDTLAKYATSMGLGRQTGIVLEHEKSGLIPTSDWKLHRYRVPWQDGETLSVAIGQGFNLTTPLQICQMTVATANDGILYKPLLIDSIMNPEGDLIQKFSPTQTGKTIASPESFALVRNALIDVVNTKRGTAKVAQLENITIAGKTGTAQVVRLVHHRDLQEEDIPYKYRDHAWFTAYAPAEKPEIAVTVLVEHGMHGGSSAAPIAKTIIKKYFELKSAATKEKNSNEINIDRDTRHAPL
ncbi:MAG: penicillin-binding protein 2 [Desulfobulbaceae bacterium]|nr:penicillin-binding protein 2 [Desulfobulbaceae bacterium]HIJ77685.1 penicillin-binding protein 2 [Deltaproteobacteria bacterium]